MRISSITRRSFTVLGVTGFAIATIHLAPARADLVLETETAELGSKGHGLFSTAVQFERQRDGSRVAFTLNQFEYALSDRAEILIEPFFYERDHAADGSRFSGRGDLEITPSYLIKLETARKPALVLAFKLKVPTGSAPDISTGKSDYLPYVIIGKHYGRYILNANLGYNFITSTKEERLSNQFIYDFSVERVMTPRLSVYAEAFANSSPASGQRGTFSGALATEYHFSRRTNAFVSVGYDSDHLVNIRPGFNLEF